MKGGREGRRGRGAEGGGYLVPEGLFGLLPQPLRLGLWEEGGGVIERGEWGEEGVGTLICRNTPHSATHRDARPRTNLSHKEGVEDLLVGGQGPRLVAGLLGHLCEKTLRDGGGEGEREREMQGRRREEGVRDGGSER